MAHIGRLHFSWRRGNEELYEDMVDRAEFAVRDRIRDRLKRRDDDLRQMIAKVARAETKDWIDTIREDAAAAAAVPCVAGYTDHDYNASGFCRRCPETVYSFQDRLAALVGRPAWAAGLQVDFRTAGSTTESLRVGQPREGYEIPEALMPDEVEPDYTAEELEAVIAAERAEIAAEEAADAMVEITEDGGGATIRVPRIGDGGVNVLDLPANTRFTIHDDGEEPE